MAEYGANLLLNAAADHAITEGWSAYSNVAITTEGFSGNAFRFTSPAFLEQRLSSDITGELIYGFKFGGRARFRNSGDYLYAEIVLYIQARIVTEQETFSAFLPCQTILEPGTSQWMLFSKEINTRYNNIQEIYFRVYSIDPNVIVDVDNLSFSLAKDDSGASEAYEGATKYTDIELEAHLNDIINNHLTEEQYRGITGDVPKLKTVKLGLETEIRAANRNVYNNNVPEVSTYVRRKDFAFKTAKYWTEVLVQTVPNALDTSVAVQYDKNGIGKIFVAFVTGTTLVVRAAQFVYPVSEMEWETLVTIEGAAKCALAFDNTLHYTVAPKIEAYTEEKPWLFYTTLSGQLVAGNLEGPYYSVVGANVTAMDVIRGFAGYGKTPDQGMLAFYVIAGKLYYKEYIAGIWGDQRSVGLAPDNIVKLRADRTFDWRIVLQLEDSSGKLYEMFSKMESSGWQSQEFIMFSNVSATGLLTEIQYIVSDTYKEAIVLSDITVDGWNMSVYHPVLLEASNISVWKDEPDDPEDEEFEPHTDWGYVVKFSAEQHIRNAKEHPEMFRLTDNTGAFWYGQSVEYASNKSRHLFVTFLNFNNATNPIKAELLGDPLTNGYIELEYSYVEFNATNLVPYATDPPVFVDAWNVGSQAIVIEFNKPITNIASQSGFAITGFEPFYSPEGHLVPTDYEVESITQEDVPTLYIPDFDEGVHDDTVEDDGTVKLIAEDMSVNVLRFNGTNTNVNIPHKTALKPTSAITVEFIANSELWNSATIKTMLSCTEAGGWSISTKENKTTDMDFWISVGGSWKNVGYALNSLSNNVNYHFAGVYDGSKVYLYINGMLVGSVNATGSISYSYNNSIFIGAEAGKAAAPDQNYYWKGKIKDVRIWNVARTGQQIVDNMNKQLVGNEAGLVGYWKLDEGAGTTAYDNTANANNGTISNGTWTTEGGLGDYTELGTYTAEPYEIESELDLRLNWTSTEPEDTEIKGYYAIDVEEPISITWLPIDNGDVIEVGEDNIGKHVHIMMELSTEDVEVTPVLVGLYLEQAHPSVQRIQINLTYDGRLKHPQGKVTVDFTGSLLGPLGSQVAPFIEEFKPVLDPVWFNPANVEKLELTNITAVGELTRITYVLFEQLPEDFIQLSNVTASGTLTHIDDLEQ